MCLLTPKSIKHKHNVTYVYTYQCELCEHNSSGLNLPCPEDECAGKPKSKSEFLWHEVIGAPSCARYMDKLKI